MASSEETCSIIIKPSSPTPSHLKNYTLSLLDQLAPPFYVPVLLFYSSPPAETPTNDVVVSENLKISLSKTLSDFYPFAGRFKGNSTIDCNDKGALFTHSKSKAILSKFLENPDASQLQQFLPFPPYTMTSSEEHVLLAVKVTAFDCGGIGIGVCLSHKVSDGSTAATFLNSWSNTATINGPGDFKISPCFDASAIFRPKDFKFTLPSGVIRPEKLVTKRFRFGRKDLLSLRNEFRNMNPTKVEAVSALIWKTALEAAKACSEKNVFPPSAVTHVVNIRSRADPPLPDRTVGNLWQSSIAPLVELPSKGDIELDDLGDRLRKSIKRIDSNHVSGLQGEGGFGNACRSLMEAREMAVKGGVELYRFSSWTRFPFYEVDLLGWGKPTWVSTTSVPVKNVVILMGNRSGDGIEAWVTLTEDEMGSFQSNPKLLQFVSVV